MREARAVHDTTRNPRRCASSLVLVLFGAQNVPHDTDQDDLPEKTVRRAGNHDQAFEASQGANENGSRRGTVVPIIRQQRMANTQPFSNGAAFDQYPRSSYVPSCRPLSDKQAG
jgi:hypothetical protein